MATQRTLKLNLLADVDKFGKGLNQAGQDAKGFSGKISKYGKVAAGALAAVGVAAGVMAVKFGIDAVKAASDLSEEISKSKVIFGNSAKAIEKFAEKAATSLGLSKKQAMNATSTFAILGKSAGLAGGDLADFSKDATTLAADLGSFYNTSADDAINAIGSALRGEAEPIRKFGVLLNDATIKAKAMEMKLYDGKGALDIQAKALASYQIILDETTDAQGDFNRTSDGLAGQQKIFTAATENLKTTFGQTLLPIITDFVRYANDTLLPLMKNVADGFAGKPNSISNKVQKVADEMGYGNQNAGYTLGASLNNVAQALGALFKAMVTGDADEGLSTMESLATSLNSIANGLNAIARNWGKVSGFWDKLTTSPLTYVFPGANPNARAAGGSVMKNKPYRVGEFGSEIFVPSGSGSIRKDPGGGGGNTFIFNGVIDGESARRSIERLLQSSARRTGAVNFAGSNL